MSDTYNLSQLDDIDLAAAEYALGSLDAQQKAEFEALLAVSHDTQVKVAQWQEHVQGGLHDFKPVAAPKELWPRISAQLGTNPLGVIGLIASNFGKGSALQL